MRFNIVIPNKIGANSIKMEETLRIVFFKMDFTFWLVQPVLQVSV